SAEPGGDQADLRAALDAYASPTVTIAAPATAVGLPVRVRDALAAAVGSALDDVVAHAGPGARAWVLIQTDGDAGVVTGRDDGAARGRLDGAVAGRRGVAEAIHERLSRLGGTASISSQPGHGTEVELRVPTPR